MCFGIMTSFQYLKRTAARTSRLILKGEVWKNFWLLIETSAQWKLKHWSPQGNYCQNHKNWTFCWIEPIESNHSEFRMQQIVCFSWAQVWSYTCCIFLLAWKRKILNDKKPGARSVTFMLLGTVSQWWQINSKFTPLHLYSPTQTNIPPCISIKATSAHEI